VPLQRSSCSAELIPLSADQSFSNLAASAEPRQQQPINNQSTIENIVAGVSLAEFVERKNRWSHPWPGGPVTNWLTQTAAAVYVETADGEQVLPNAIPVRWPTR
jgi:hypothetical protein